MKEARALLEALWLLFVQRVDMNDYRKLLEESEKLRTQLRMQLDDTEQKLKALQIALRTMNKREQALDAREDKLDAREAQLDLRHDRLDVREEQLVARQMQRDELTGRERANWFEASRKDDGDGRDTAAH